MTGDESIVVYLELDSISDTRLTTLYNANKTLMEKLVVTKNYQNRVSDNFEFISTKLFETLYSRRDNEVLSKSYFTGILGIVREYLGTIAEQRANTGDSTTADIYINIYPYNITQRDSKAISESLLNELNIPLKVHFIRADNYELTTNWLYDIGVNVMFKYDGLKWLDKQLSKFDKDKRTLAGVSLFIPALADRLIVKEEDYSKFFQEYAEQLSMFVDIKFIEAKYFSHLV